LIADANQMMTHIVGRVGLHLQYQICINYKIKTQNNNKQETGAQGC